MKTNATVSKKQVPLYPGGQEGGQKETRKEKCNKKAIKMEKSKK
jgi:hypothetical protein